MFDVYGLTQPEKRVLASIIETNFLIELIENDISRKILMIDSFDSEYLADYYSKEVKALQSILIKLKKFKGVYLNEM